MRKNMDHPHLHLPDQVKQGIRRNFARRADTYDRHAGVQREMAARLLDLTEGEIRRAGRILEVGCGTGHLTLGLRRLNPHGLLVAIDLDPCLLARARARLGPDPRTCFAAADGEAFAGGPFDLIIANAAFQWFRHPGEALATYQRQLLPGGALAFATLGPATFRELAWSLDHAARLLGRPAPPPIPARRFPTAEEWRRLLQASGFTRLSQAHGFWRRPHPSVQDFLHSLKATGATNPIPLTLSPRFFQTFVQAYRAGFGSNGSIPVTYEVIWFLGYKDA
jgi:malonyl-CoA O-methyltransferase